jgi:medium-chain acyl-[acyl-carrier-protein] hydrolase
MGCRTWTSPCASARGYSVGLNSGLVVTGPWFHQFQETTSSSRPLLCFPFAGGAAAAYRPWIADLPAWTELWAVELPGHAARREEVLVADLHVLADQLSTAIRARFTGPFDFFGHSMGALLAFEVCRRLARAGAPLPRVLAVSAQRAPQLPAEGLSVPPLNDDDFVTLLQRRYEGIPLAISSDRELMKLFLPALRNDVTALERYRYQPDQRLSVPILAFAGDADDTAPAHEMAGWREQTAGPFALHVVEGGHFFIHTQRRAVLRLLSDHLASPPSQISTRDASARRHR